MLLAIQAGLLTPLNFAQHHLKVPWLLLLPVHTFFTMEGGDSEFANFTLPTLNHFLRHVVIMGLEISNNLLLVLWDAPKKKSTNSRSSDQAKNDAKTLFVHPPSPFQGNFCNCNSIGICTASQF